jgi:hypothetical protein
MSDVGKNYVIALVEWHQVLNWLFSMSASTLPIQSYGLYKKKLLPMFVIVLLFENTETLTEIFLFMYGTWQNFRFLYWLEIQDGKNHGHLFLRNYNIDWT